jgi:tRNA 2-thiocytidine biosynthesis protein TtcA
MNLLFEGEISAMAPYQEMFRGKLSIIRPLAYVDEDDIEELAHLNRFPVPHCLCPNANTTKRSVVAKFVKELEKTTPSVKTNIFRSLQRIKKDYLL